MLKALIIFYKYSSYVCSNTESNERILARFRPILLLLHILCLRPYTKRTIIHLNRVIVSFLSCVLLHLINSINTLIVPICNLILVKNIATTPNYWLIQFGSINFWRSLEQKDYLMTISFQAIAFSRRYEYLSPLPTNNEKYQWENTTYISRQMLIMEDLTSFILTNMLSTPNFKESHQLI